MPLNPIMKPAVFACAINTAYGSIQFVSYLFKQRSVICTSRSNTICKAFKVLYKRVSLIFSNFLKVHNIVLTLLTEKTLHKESMYNFSKAFSA